MANPRRAIPRWALVSVGVASVVSALPAVDMPEQYAKLMKVSKMLGSPGAYGSAFEVELTCDARPAHRKAVMKVQQGEMNSRGWASLHHGIMDSGLSNSTVTDENFRSAFMNANHADNKDLVQVAGQIDWHPTSSHSRAIWEVEYGMMTKDCDTCATTYGYTTMKPNLYVDPAAVSIIHSSDGFEMENHRFVSEHNAAQLTEIKGQNSNDECVDRCGEFADCIRAFWNHDEKKCMLEMVKRGKKIRKMDLIRDVKWSASTTAAVRNPMFVLMQHAGAALGHDNFQTDPLQSAVYLHDWLLAVEHFIKLGTIHRDIKPDNVSITDALTKLPNPKVTKRGLLIDYGLGCLASVDDPNDERFCWEFVQQATGMFSYFSPEATREDNQIFHYYQEQFFQGVDYFNAKRFELAEEKTIAVFKKDSSDNDEPLYVGYMKNGDSGKGKSGSHFVHMEGEEKKKEIDAAEYWKLEIGSFVIHERSENLYDIFEVTADLENPLVNVDCGTFYAKHSFDGDWVYERMLICQIPTTKSIVQVHPGQVFFTEEQLEKGERVIVGRSVNDYVAETMKVTEDVQQKRLTVSKAALNAQYYLDRTTRVPSVKKWTSGTMTYNAVFSKTRSYPNSIDVSLTRTTDLKHEEVPLFKALLPKDTGKAYDTNVKLTQDKWMKAFQNAEANPKDAKLRLRMSAPKKMYLMEPSDHDGAPRNSEAADVYSLGIVFHELLYGRQPTGIRNLRDHIEKEFDEGRDGSRLSVQKFITDIYMRDGGIGPFDSADDKSESGVILDKMFQSMMATDYEQRCKPAQCMQMLKAYAHALQKDGPPHEYIDLDKLDSVSSASAPECVDHAIACEEFCALEDIELPLDFNSVAFKARMAFDKKGACESICKPKQSQQKPKIQAPKALLKKNDEVKPALKTALNKYPSRSGPSGDALPIVSAKKEEPKANNKVFLGKRKGPSVRKQPTVENLDNLSAERLAYLAERTQTNLPMPVICYGPPGAPDNDSTASGRAGRMSEFDHVVPESTFSAGESWAHKDFSALFKDSN